MLSAWSKLLGNLRAFRRAREGNVAITFAVAALPILGFVGAAVDYSHANSVRVALQSALDSTALMLARDAATINQDALNTKALAYFQALFTKPEGSNIKISATYTTAGGSAVAVNGAVDVPTTFMGIAGFEHITVSGSATSKWGSTRLRVALALDTTGSMNSDGKMTALKSATKNLLTQLEAAASNNGDVYVSIVPFSKNVNVGPSNYNANWIDWTDWEATPTIISGDIRSSASTWEQVGPGDSCPFDTSGWGGTNKYGFGCTTTPTGTTTTNTVPSSGTYKGYICPSTDSGKNNSTKIGIMYNGCYKSVESTRTISTGKHASCGSAVNCSCSGNNNNKKCTQTYYEHPWVLNAKSTWNGCVTDRGTTSGPSSDYDRKVVAPGAAAASKYPAEQNAYCSPQAMGLSYSWSTMKSLAENLYPLGATNQPIGLVWGWQSLVGGGPFTVPAKEADYKYTEAIILMSDGMNTLNRWYGNGSSTNTSVDKRMYDNGPGTCANIKAAGITIYTIHVNTDNDPVSTLLKNCASDSEKFWTVTSAGDLVNVFSQIGTNLTKLRVAK